MQRLIRISALSTLAVGLLAGGVVAKPPVMRAASNDVVRAGSCSMGSDWKLKVSPEDGRLEVQFEVDQNRNGQIWNVVLKHNGTTFWSGQRTTQPPSGSFEVRKLTANAAGTDQLTGRATNRKTGEVCKGTVSI